jgi:hypothetical protein
MMICPIATNGQIEFYWVGVPAGGAIDALYLSQIGIFM